MSFSPDKKPLWLTSRSHHPLTPSVYSKCQLLCVNQVLTQGIKYLHLELELFSLLTDLSNSRNPVPLCTKRNRAFWRLNTSNTKNVTGAACTQRTEQPITIGIPNTGDITEEKRKENSKARGEVKTLQRKSADSDRVKLPISANKKFST